jgi:hypothetical protein
VDAVVGVNIWIVHLVAVVALGKLFDTSNERQLVFHLSMTVVLMPLSSKDHQEVICPSKTTTDVAAKQFAFAETYLWLHLCKSADQQRRQD